MGKPLVDRTNRRYGNLSVIGQSPSYRGNARWCCKCDCGFYTIVLGNDLERGKVKSCGCWNAKRIVSHGLSRAPVYLVWKAMLQRCTNPKSPSYPGWGGRGIQVCEGWRDFRNFFADMGHPPEGRYSLEREDNDGHYEPGNCRWVTIDVQANNTRRNRLIEYQGRSQTLAQWAQEYGMGWYTLRSRLDLYGWSVEKALTTPVGKKGINRNTRFLTQQGRTQSVSAWAAEVGLSAHTLRNRLEKGWPQERALTEPKRW